MSDPTQKEMLTQLVRDVKHIMDKQDKMKIKQDDMELVLHDVQIDISGTITDPSRGIVFRVGKNEECIASMRKKQTRIVTWGVTIFGLINILAAIALIYNALNG